MSLYEFNCCTEFWKHVVNSKMSLFHVSFCLINSNCIQWFLIRFAKVDTYFLNICKNNKKISINSFCKLSGCEVFFDNSTCAT